jgi:hypothetical protein
MAESPTEASTAVPGKRYAVTLRDGPTFDVAELELQNERLKFSKKVRKVFDPWFEAPYSSIVRIRPISPYLILKSPAGKELLVDFSVPADANEATERLRTLAKEYWSRPFDAPSAAEGCLAPEAPETPCGGCGLPAVTTGQNPYFLKPPDYEPRYCTECGKWFHKRCLKKSALSGEQCPSCQRPVLHPSFFCGHCNCKTNTTEADTWPNFRCINCSRATSLLAREGVGAQEVLLMVAIGALPAAAFVATLVYDAPAWLKWLTGLIAAPLALPWIANAVAAVLAGIMPGSANAVAPAAGGVRLSVVDARAFRASPLVARMKQVYTFYVVNTIPAIFFSAVAIGFILAVTEFSKK